eukprot:gene20719-22753_t
MALAPLETIMLTLDISPSRSQLAQNSIPDDIEIKDNEQSPHSYKNLTITDEEACHVASRLSFQDPENEPSQASNQSESAVTFKDINRKAKRCKLLQYIVFEMPSPVSISSDIHAATPVTPVGALQSVSHLSEICDSDWNSFLQKVKQLDQSFMEQCRLFLLGHEEEFTMRTLLREVAVIDKMRRGRNGLPDGMVPATATVGLESSEDEHDAEQNVELQKRPEQVENYRRRSQRTRSVPLRDHYITTDDAYQMVYSLSTLAVNSRRPTGKKTTASDILRFAITSEIMEIAKSHSFCGLLQVRYLAGVISRNINLHCPFHPFYHGLMSPCLCQANVIFRPINILFISTGSSSFPNHYVPLIWKIGQRSVVNELPRTKPSKRCAASKRLGCHAVGDEREEWVNCANCSLHYHATCSGILEKRGTFICCLNKKARGDIMRDINSIKDFSPETTSILQWPQIVLKPKSSEVTVILTLFDLFCIHSYGLSTSAVEFYIKLLQNNIVTDCGIFVSNVFQANKILTDKEAMKNPRFVFLRDRLLESSIVIFPCAQRMCVLDSMNAQSATNRRYLSTFKEYLQHLQRHEENEVTYFFELDSKEYNVEQNATIEIKDSFNLSKEHDGK